MLLLAKASFEDIRLQHSSSAASESEPSSGTAVTTAPELGTPSTLPQQTAATAPISRISATPAAPPAAVAADAVVAFTEGVLMCLKGDLRGCSDVPRLLEGASLVVQLCNIAGVSDQALQVAMVLLVNRYPKVRARFWWLV